MCAEQVVWPDEVGRHELLQMPVIERQGKCHTRSLPALPERPPAPLPDVKTV